MKQKKWNDRKHLNVWRCVNLISVQSALITRTIYILLSQWHSSRFQFWQVQNAVYFYLRSFLSSSEKAKWVVVDSFFSTSIPKIVLAAYSGVVVQGVKRRVTGRGPGTRAESCELSCGEEQRVPALAASFTIYLWVCICVLVLLSLCGRIPTLNPWVRTSLLCEDISAL